MYSDYGGNRSFCSSPECYDFAGGNDVVNAAIPCSHGQCATTCDACNEAVHEAPSFIKFSNMPLPMASPPTPTSSSTKLQKKSSKAMKKNEKISMSCEVKEANVGCKVNAKEVRSKKDVLKVKGPCEGSSRLENANTSKRKINGDLGSSKCDGQLPRVQCGSDHDVGGTMSKTSCSSNKMDRGPDKMNKGKGKSNNGINTTKYDGKPSDLDVRGTISKSSCSSNKMDGRLSSKFQTQNLSDSNKCGGKSPSAKSGAPFEIKERPSKSSCSSKKLDENIDPNDEIFDLITDDNVVVRCQCKCNDHNCPNRHHQNEFGSPTVKYRKELSKCPGSGQNSENTKLSKTGLKNIKERQRNSSSFPKQTTPSAPFSPSSSHKPSSNLRNTHLLDSIEEEYDSTEPCLKSCSPAKVKLQSKKTPCQQPSSFSCESYSKSKFNSNGCKPFPDIGHTSRSHKPLEESCIDFLNIISDNVMESVENSLNEALCEFSQRISEKIELMREKLERNESMMSGLYCAIMEKFGQQNDDMCCQFRALLEFLMENEAKKEQQGRHGSIDGGCSNKECQCDLYTDRLFSGNDNSAKANNRYRSVPFRSSENEKIPQSASNAINENRYHKCCGSCQGHVPQDNSANNSQSGGNWYSRQSKRSLGGGGGSGNSNELTTTGRDHCKCHEKHLIDWHNPQIYDAIVKRQTTTQLSYQLPYRLESSNSLERNTAARGHRNYGGIHNFKDDRKYNFLCKSNEDQETSGYVSEPEDNTENLGNEPT